MGIIGGRTTWAEYARQFRLRLSKCWTSAGIRDIRAGLSNLGKAFPACWLRQMLKHGLLIQAHACNRDWNRL